VQIVVRRVVDPDSLDDLVALRAQGVTEVLLDLNLSPRVGSPDVDAGAALEYAERVLDAFAPQR
jgi:hypothetical protein